LLPGPTVAPSLNIGRRQIGSDLTAAHCMRTIAKTSRALIREFERGPGGWKLKPDELADLNRPSGDRRAARFQVTHEPPKPRKLNLCYPWLLAEFFPGGKR
jgi:hypothetical protein